MDSITTLEELKSLQNSCYACSFSKNRSNLVFGSGNSLSSIMLIGEAPGYNEDIDGEPFTGKAGKLLDRMLSSIGLERLQDCYSTNILKCRPEDNRDPLPDEIEICTKYLDKQIELVNPKLIVSIGKYSTSWLLGREPAKTPITKLSGNFFQYKETPFMPLLHPAYLLRNENAKVDAWGHLKILFKYIEEKNLGH